MVNFKKTSCHTILPRIFEKSGRKRNILTSYFEKKTPNCVWTKIYQQIQAEPGANFVKAKVCTCQQSGILVVRDFVEFGRPLGNRVKKLLVIMSSASVVLVIVSRTAEVSVVVSTKPGNFRIFLPLVLRETSFG